MAYINDEYEKLYIIGKGSYATIWKARHKELGYVRALKMSNEQVENENDPAYKSFLNECKMLLQLGNGSHPNIVHIYKPWLIENRAVVEMDYVDGETLDQYLQRERFLPISEVYKFINDIVGALAYCHHDIYRYLMNPNVDDLKTDPNDGHNFIIDQATEQRLVAKYAVTHNDLHSRNIMRRHYDGNYMLLDFGLAIQDGKAVKSSSRRGGALEYMSPEKFSDSSTITTQSDVYSLGILLYEVLAGRVPFVLDQKAFESNPTEASYIIMKAHKEAIPPDISILRREAFEKAFPGQTYVKDYPDELESIILRCLEKNPANRYPNAKVLYEDIKKITADNSVLLLQEQLQQANNTIARLEDELIERQGASDVEMAKENQLLKARQSQLSSEISKLKQDNMKSASEVEALKQAILNLKSQKRKKKIAVFFAVVFFAVAAVLGCLFWQKNIQVTDLKSQTLQVDDMETSIGVWMGGITYDSVMNGHGYLEYYPDDTDGRKLYIGQMNNGKKSGKGLLVYKSKTSFSGEFENDNFKEGKYKVPSENMYFEGDFKDNKPYNGKWYDWKTDKILFKIKNGKNQ